MIYLRRADMATRKSGKRGFVRERIIRTLLNCPDGSLTKYRVAKSAEASYPWTHAFLREMERRGAVENTRVTDFRKLVLLLRKFRVAPERMEYMVQNPLGLLRSAKMEYALTTYAAENLTQRHLFPSRIDFYIDPKDRDEWHRVLSREGLVGKGNTRVLIGDARILCNSSEKDGLKVVSTPQLMVDLLEEGGPCAEAAGMLMEREEDRLVRGQ